MLDSESCSDWFSMDTLIIQFKVELFVKLYFYSKLPIQPILNKTGNELIQTQNVIITFDQMSNIVAKSFQSEQRRNMKYVKCEFLRFEVMCAVMTG